MQHLLILRDPHIGLVISVIWKFWTLEFKFQQLKVLKKQRQTGNKFMLQQSEKKLSFKNSDIKKTNLHSTKNMRK